MTRSLRFTKAEISNAALIARSHGVAVKLDRDGSILVFPDNHRPAKVDEPEDDGATALRKWRESRNAGKAHGRS